MTVIEEKTREYVNSPEENKAIIRKFIDAWIFIWLL